jgi:phospholipase/carboxylesterase
MHKELIIYSGNRTNATKALIMLHGRGAGAEDILSLAGYFPVTDYLLAAPQATNNSWYPNSFLAVPQDNEPWLSSALGLISKLVSNTINHGIQKEHIYFLGFSQGACLTLEYTARNATRYGGIVAFTGGLIGDRIYPENYSGDFEGTPVFLGTSDPDFHVPVQRVYASSNMLRNMGADLTEKIYPNMGHTVNQDEIDQVNKLIFKK